MVKLDIKDYVGKTLLIIERSAVAVTDTPSIIECVVDKVSGSSKYIKVTFPNRDRMGGWISVVQFDKVYSIIEAL